MSDSYKLTVNNKTQFNLQEHEIVKLDAIEVEKSKFHILKNDISFKAEIISSDFLAKKYTIKVNNTVYEVAIADGLDLIIESFSIHFCSTLCCLIF